MFLPFRALSAPPAPRGVLRGVPSLPDSLHSFFSSVRRRCRTGCGATDWTKVYGTLVAEVGSGELSNEGAAHEAGELAPDNSFVDDRR